MGKQEVIYSNEFMDIVLINPNYPFLMMKKPGVVVVPYDKEGNIYMIHKERKNIGKYYELPRGFVEIAEDFHIGALRELLEETGMKAKKAIKLGKLQNDTGLMSNNVEVIAMLVTKSENKTHYDDADEEDNIIVQVNRDKIYDLIISGDIICSLSLSALNKFWAFRAKGMLKGE